MMLLRVVFALVHAHDHGEAIALGRSGNDDLLGTGGNVALGLLDGGEQAGGLDHEVHAQRLPRQFGRRLGADHLHFLAVDDEHVRIGVLGLFAGGLGLGHGFREVLLSTLPLKRPWMESYLSKYARLSAGTISPTATTSMSLPTMPCSTRARINQASDAAEPVNCNFDCHKFVIRFAKMFCENRKHNLQANASASMPNSGTELPNPEHFLLAFRRGEKFEKAGSPRRADRLVDRRRPGRALLPKSCHSAHHMISGKLVDYLDAGGAFVDG